MQGKKIITIGFDSQLYSPLTSCPKVNLCGFWCVWVFFDGLGGVRVWVCLVGFVALFVCLVGAWGIFWGELGWLVVLLLLFGGWAFFLFNTGRKTKSFRIPSPKSVAKSSGVGKEEDT